MKAAGLAILQHIPELASMALPMNPSWARSRGLRSATRYQDVLRRATPCPAPNPASATTRRCPIDERSGPDPGDAAPARSTLPTPFMPGRTWVNPPAQLRYGIVPPSWALATGVIFSTVSGKISLGSAAITSSPAGRSRCRPLGLRRRPARSASRRAGRSRTAPVRAAPWRRSIALRSPDTHQSVERRCQLRPRELLVASRIWASDSCDLGAEDARVGAIARPAGALAFDRLALALGHPAQPLEHEIAIVERREHCPMADLVAGARLRFLDEAVEWHATIARCTCPRSRRWRSRDRCRSRHREPASTRPARARGACCRRVPVRAAPALVAKLLPRLHDQPAIVAAVECRGPALERRRDIRGARFPRLRTDGRLSRSNVMAPMNLSLANIGVVRMAPQPCASANSPWARTMCDSSRADG